MSAFKDDDEAAAVELLARLFRFMREGAGGDPETLTEPLRKLSRDNVYALKWYFEQCLAVVDTEFQSRPEEY